MGSIGENVVDHVVALSQPSHILFGPSLGVAVALVTTNTWLRKYTARHADSWLKQQNDEGILCMEAWNYIVSVTVQLLLIPIWLSICLITRPDNWWYGWDVDSMSAAFASILIGYYLQDSITNWYENSNLILVHHIGTVVLIVLCFIAEAWHGLFLTVGFSYELGSMAMGLVDLRLVSRWIGPVGMITTTLFGMSMILVAFWQHIPSDASTWCAALMFLLAGLARVNQASLYLSQSGIQDYKSME